MYTIHAYYKIEIHIFFGEAAGDEKLESKSKSDMQNLLVRNFHLNERSMQSLDENYCGNLNGP